MERREYKIDVSYDTIKKVAFLVGAKNGDKIRIRQLQDASGVNYHKLVDLVKNRRATQKTIDAIELAEKQLRAKNAATLKTAIKS